MHGSEVEFTFEVSDYFVVDRPVGLVVRRPPRGRKIPGSNPACDGISFGVESYQ